MNSSFPPVTLPSLLKVLGEYRQFMLLDNLYGTDEKEFDLLAGAGVFRSISTWNPKLISSFLEEAASAQKFVFCHITYPLKDALESLKSKNREVFGWPVIHLFVPCVLLTVKNGSLYIHSYDESDPEDIYRKFLSAEHNGRELPLMDVVHAGISKEAYLQNVHKLKEHIQRGDIYEINYCFEFTGEGKIDPYATYLFLDKKSPAPFACMYKQNDNYLISSSPERFVKKRGNRIISQPIKGTARRGRNAVEDKEAAAALANDEKERSENIMIVDLVRNDLSRIAERGSVTVDELCGIYSFPAVHQMISTVSATIKEDLSFATVVSALFPMGSMTGAPKISAMKLIDRYENFNRGIYSGSVGYIHPDGDFDLNVVIRSIIYNEKSGRISIPAGSAITAASSPEKEYEECFLKAEALINSLMQ